ncbi:class I SAM-dependent methyltransferase [Methanogenium sp. MK-MG]|uniref:class I SAM-dependent methyltransferase n=1 Tax=Methanogenium sp. MK-MG TaxID=2599926 RepID=UPI0013ED7482|nr:class I SAM-dependent methyltransferase [Methanogenium sp. MK-MG]KAF1077230.1 23S rRNA (uracil(1939)-C(5))-methyltransferase RlmD [Methanogenium sp. MK-MG]
MTQTNIDWNECWKEQWQKNHEINKRKDTSGMWDEQDAARKFYRMSYEKNGERVNRTIAGLALTPESRVLDVGAGPGAITIPIARRVSHVTAVEPSEGMFAVLKENLRDEEIENADCIQKRWEDVDVAKDLSGPYNLVFASFSLDVHDMKAAITKMCEASSQYVYIYWFAGEASWEKMAKDLWPKLHGTAYEVSPKSDIIFSILYQMGIYPHVEHFVYEHIYRFSTEEEAIEYFRPRHLVTTEEQEELLREYIMQSLEHDGDTVTVPGHSHRMKIWWDVNDFPADE